MIQVVQVSSDYGIDDLAPMPELQTNNNVEVPRSTVSLSPIQQEMLAQVINPFSDDQSSGVNLYCQTLAVMANLVN